MGYAPLSSLGHDCYRYVLRVKTDDPGERALVVIQCNPSSADSTRSDPTVGKVLKWAKENAFKDITFLNLFARKSARVCDIDTLPYDELVGPGNDDAIREHARSGSTLVLAWGGTLPVGDEHYRRRVEEVRQLLPHALPHVVGRLSYGCFPRHGRMWNKGNRDLWSISWNDLLAKRR